MHKNENELCVLDNITSENLKSSVENKRNGVLLKKLLSLRLDLTARGRLGPTGTGNQK